MRRNTARNMNADGSDFALSSRRVLRGCRTTLIRRAAPPQVAPDAGEATDASGLDAEFGAEADESLFHQTDEVDRAQTGAEDERRLRRSKMG